MATNNFKAFALADNANVTAQADYEALPALASGFQGGKASSAQINKALRQSSTMAAVLGQFITQANLDALDNGNLSALLTNFINAMSSNLGLGTASKRDVGTGNNQIPDMASFANGSNGNGQYYRFPGGMQICRTSISAPGNTTATWTFPLAFLYAPQIVITPVVPPSAVPSTMWVSGVSTTSASVYNPNSTGTNINLIAII
ncbi:hypothetical protein [Pantoea ananatis]|uniref:hypothetical protein n=1 Tax=Pantoea ananas TaxID=553 RepID=UPI001576A528|nr:hypothetical protein [Pantoea ananatis]NQE76859.1 hypothetical protein [Pantoea ananatis]NQE81495.1 hypothetical protein [Pantoea ananatis]